MTPAPIPASATYDPDEIMNAEEAVWDAIHGLFEADEYPANWDTQFHVIEAALERVAEASRRDGVAGAEWERTQAERLVRAAEATIDYVSTAADDLTAIEATPEQHRKYIKICLGELREALAAFRALESPAPGDEHEEEAQ